MPDRPFLAEIEEFFVSTVRKGLMLRTRDVDIVRDWEARGVPVAVVRQGILTGIRRFLERSDPAAPLPSSLTYYRSFVESEFETWLRASGQQRTFDAMRARARPENTDPVKKALYILEGLAQRAATLVEARLWEAGASHLRSLVAMGRGPAEALDDTDEFLVQAFLETAPVEVRQRVESRVRARVEEASRRGLGPVALRDVERSETRAAVFAESGFESLVAQVIGLK